ncbi:MAG: hypothetical protein ABFQ95_06825 [Pseudomonadota bacterium]
MNYLSKKFLFFILGCVVGTSVSASAPYVMYFEQQAQKPSRVQIYQDDDLIFGKTLDSSDCGAPIELGSLGTLQLDDQGQIENFTLNALEETIQLIGAIKTAVFNCQAANLINVGTLEVTRQGTMNLTQNLRNEGVLSLAKGKYNIDNLCQITPEARMTIYGGVHMQYGDINNLGQIISKANLTIKHHSDVQCLGKVRVEGTLRLKLGDRVNREILLSEVTSNGKPFVGPLSSAPSYPVRTSSPNRQKNSGSFRKSSKKRSVPQDDAGFLTATQLYNVLEELKKIPQGKNVHQFNKTFVVKHREFILKCNQDLGAKKTWKFNAIQQQIQRYIDFTGDGDFPKLKDAWQKLKGYLQKHPIDRETGLNVAEMLSQTWDLCLRLNVMERQNQLFGLNTGRFLAALSENIEENGGCFPGFAGRLFRENIYFLRGFYYTP